MINIPELLRHSIEKQKLRPISDVRQLIYEKTRLAVKSKLNELNAPDFIQRSYMLRLEAAICEVEAFYLLKPEYFVLRDNKVPCHFAYRAYLPDYFGTRRDVVVDPSRLRQLASGQKTFGHLFSHEDDLLFNDAELFEFRTRNTANNRATGLNNKSRIIEFSDRKGAGQSHVSLPQTAEIKHVHSRQDNVYPAVDNGVEAYMEGQRGALKAFLQRVPDRQPVNVGDASVYGQATARQVQPRRQDVRENRHIYYVPQPPVQEQQLNANTRNNSQFSDRERGKENDRRPSFPAGEQLRAESLLNGGGNAPKQANPHQILREQMEALQRTFNSDAKVKGYDSTVHESFSKPTVLKNASPNIGTESDSFPPNIFFIDKTAASANSTASNVLHPNSTGRKMPVNEQIRELERQFFKREAVVMTMPSPSSQIAETARPVSNNVSTQEEDNGSRITEKNENRSALPSQDNLAGQNNDMTANFNSAVSRDLQYGRPGVGQPSESLFAKAANNGDKFITEPLVRKTEQALNTQTDLANDKKQQTSEDSSSKIPEPFSLLNVKSENVAGQKARDDDGIKALETAEDKEAKIKRVQDNGNLFTFNDIDIEQIAQEDEEKQKFGNVNDAVDDETPIPDFIVKYDKESDDLFDRLESSQSPIQPELQPQPMQVSQETQLQTKPFEQDVLPKILSFDRRNDKKHTKQVSSRFLPFSLHENLRGKGSIAAGILLACVASSGVYYFLRGHTPASTTINNEGDKQKFDLSQTAAINRTSSLKQKSDVDTGSNSKEPAKTPQYDMSSQPLDQTRKDVSLPPVVVYPSGGQSPYQEAMLEPPRNDGLSGVNPQDAKIQTKPRTPASMLLKDKKGMQKKLAGSVLWSLVPPHSSDNPYDETALIGDFTTEDGLLDVRMTIRKNYRDNLDATHLIDLAFSQFDGFEAGPVVDVRGIYFGDKANILNKQAPATVANLYENNFVASLRRVPDDQEYNKYFIGRAKVFGFPATFRDGKTALFVLNKGTQDQAIFDKFNDDNTH